MSSYLTPCGACGHVQNHHSKTHGCHISGCLCERFSFSQAVVSVERHNEVVHEANRIIRELRAENQRLLSRSPEGEAATDAR